MKTTRNENQPDVIYAFAEGMYLRMQAGDVLTRCVEEDSTAPIHQLVESLVMAGPTSLPALREIMGETQRRRLQVEEDLRQLYDGFAQNLAAHQVPVEDLGSPAELTAMLPFDFMKLLASKGVGDEDVQTSIQLWEDTHEFARTLREHIERFDMIKTFIQDWMWGLAYNLAHQTPGGRLPPTKPYIQ